MCVHTYILMHTGGCGEPENGTESPNQSHQLLWATSVGSGNRTAGLPEEQLESPTAEQSL